MDFDPRMLDQIKQALQSNTLGDSVARAAVLRALVAAAFVLARDERAGDEDAAANAMLAVVWELFALGRQMGTPLDESLLQRVATVADLVTDAGNGGRSRFPG